MSVNNDISTSPPKRALPFWVRFFLLPAIFSTVICLAVLFVPGAGWNSNDVSTGESDGYPDLLPRRYDSSPENTLTYAAAAASGLRNWKVVRRDTDAGKLFVEVRTAIPLFTDDVTVTVTSTGANGESSQVHVRSVSRVGRGDLGENSRHIRALQSAMDERLPLLRDAAP
ncbi:MAG: DUF1499 domain-containing protein [Armatimonadetes bacterium]|nr:DUF1499 domain-containing protein [Armatimonadota bacterium]